MDIDSNKQIENQFPPFRQPSFVKMDYVYKVPNIDSLKNYIMDNASTLHTDSLQAIIHALNAYSNKETYYISEEQIFELNTVQ